MYRFFLRGFHLHVDILYSTAFKYACFFVVVQWQMPNKTRHICVRYKMERKNHLDISMSACVRAGGTFDLCRFSSFPHHLVFFMCSNSRKVFWFIFLMMYWILWWKTNFRPKTKQKQKENTWLATSLSSCSSFEIAV